MAGGVKDPPVSGVSHRRTTQLCQVTHIYG